MFDVGYGDGLRVIKLNRSPFTRYAYDCGGIKPAP
jgi:hypothetical protein